MEGEDTGIEAIDTGAAPDAAESATPTPEATPEAQTSAPDAGDASTPDALDQAQPPGDFTFDWSTWDGEDFEVFPEDARPYLQGLHGHLYGRIEQRLAYVEDLAKTYEGLTQGKGHPDLTALREQYEALEASKAELEAAHAQALQERQQQYDALRGDYQSYQQKVNEAIEADANAYAAKFEKDNADIFESEELAKTFAEILEAEDEDWDLEEVAQLARLPAPVRLTARKYVREGVPPQFALQFAQANNGTPKRRPGAAITSGAKVPSRQREQAIVEKEPTTPAEKRMAAIRKHLAVAS